MSFWNGKAVFVTGAYGFTGSNLCRELLKQGARVKGLVRTDTQKDNLADVAKEIEITQGDISDQYVLESCLKGMEYCFHPAALVAVPDAIKYPDLAIRVNTLGAYQVALACLKSGIKKLLYVSTCHIYGNLSDSEYPTKETALPRPGDIYALSKYSAEFLVKAVGAQGLPIVMSRAFGKYGPGQSERFLLGRIISQVLHNKTIHLGSPRPTRDYSYVVDIVRGYLLILEKGKAGEVYHLSSGVEHTVAEIVEMICRLVGKRPEVVWNESLRPNDILRQCGDSTKSRTELGWTPSVSLEEGLAMTINWWRKRLEKSREVPCAS